MPSATIRFYFDYVSPNAYLAWTQLPTLTKRYSIAIDPIPVLLCTLVLGVYWAPVIALADSSVRFFMG